MKRIEFIAPNTAALCDTPKIEPQAGQVCVRMCYTAISAGTERANLIGEENVSGVRRTTPPGFPRMVGYSGSGFMESVGDGVTMVKPGDRVMTYWGKHSTWNTLDEKRVIPLPDNVRMDEAALAFISSFPLAAVRKLRPELGESCLVVGLGLLGLFAVQYAHLAGLMPVIAADMNPARRSLALELGADYALDPRDEGYTEQVRSLTGSKGANTVVEVTGNGDALNQALLCAAPLARVALLGCTRHPTTVDFYHDVHFPGVTLIGAHSMTRPDVESYPGNWTPADDCRAIIRYLAAGRVNYRRMISEIHAPQEAPEVFRRLAFDREFPIGVLFDWSKLSTEGEV